VITINGDYKCSTKAASLGGTGPKVNGHSALHCEKNVQ